MKFQTNRTNRGFTILELMITVLVLVILATVAVPNLRSAIQSNRMTAQANGLLTAFQLARSEALQRKVPVSVCASDTSAATPTCGSDWSQGWLVIVDSNAVGSATAAYDTAAYETDVLRVWPGTDGDATIAGANAPDFVRYLPTGRIDLDPATPMPEFELRIPDCLADNQRNIEIERTGRASVERVECT